MACSFRPLGKHQIIDSVLLLKNILLLQPPEARLMSRDSMVLGTVLESLARPCFPEASAASDTLTVSMAWAAAKGRVASALCTVPRDPVDCHVCAVARSHVEVYDLCSH